MIEATAHGLSVAAREMAMRVVAGVDVNPSALRTFGRNFPEAEAIEGSVRSGTVLERCRALLDGDGESLSVVLSGPPCQGFSAAGSRDLKDRRNGVLVAVALDKQDFADNVLALMDHSLGYILRNIQVGVSTEHGGISRPQYPEEVLRETVNNALAHRDYSVNRQIIIAMAPSGLSVGSPKMLWFGMPREPIA